jgi:hypothetical protein
MERRAIPASHWDYHAGRRDACYWLRVSSQVRSTARVLKSQRFVEIALADAGSPLQAGGRARVLRGAEVTADRYKVGTVICVQDPDMKQAWCLAASRTDVTAKQLTTLYGRRWGIECSLRDSKDLRFGLGLATMHVKSPERRDRLWLINAFAVVLLTLLGAAGEALGYDRMLKTNTAKRRVHSLFRQGCMLYDLLPTMRDDWLRPLMQRFSQMLQDQPLFTDVFGAV